MRSRRRSRRCGPAATSTRPVPAYPELREAVAAHQPRHYGIELDPASEVVVTAGATEALAAAIFALVNPGDEMVVLEPFYDSYVACIEMAGGVRRPVTLRAPDFRLDVDALRAAVTAADHDDPAEHPAQPDRRGARPAPSSRRSPRSRSSTTWWW